MEQGYLAFVLHAHLPFVRHPEFDEFLEERWLYEAITETYIPLIEAFDRLLQDQIPFKISMTVTPTLISMLEDPLLQERYLRHLDRLIELADKEIHRTRWQEPFHQLALMYHHRFVSARSIFADRYHRRLTEAFRRVAEAGALELLTCGATHGFLPLMVNRQAVRAQIRVAVALHEKTFGRRPAGIWLPECGYNPGDEEILKEAGIRYFIVDTHGILFGSPRPRFGVYSAYYTRSGVAAFGRDMESSKSVWSAQEGYPGHVNYRDFYRDIGYDLDYDYIRPYLNGDGSRISTGIKYYRITGRGDHKEPYVSEWAQRTAEEHAGNFMFNRERQVEHLHHMLGREPIVLSPYDAELFGHWWFEGPYWLEMVIRKIACDQQAVKLITPSGYLERYPRNQVLTPSMSSWGWKGYAEVWLEGSNDWIYRHLHKAAERMVEVANAHPSAQGVQRRALNQMARELLLAQSSDWAFIMKTGTMVEYAHRRTHDHIGRFNRLYQDLRSSSVDAGWLAQVETRDNLFPDIDYRIYVG